MAPEEKEPVSDKTGDPLPEATTASGSGQSGEDSSSKPQEPSSSSEQQQQQQQQQPTPHQSAQIDSFAQRLDLKSNDIRSVGIAANELRDSVEAYHNANDYPYFIEKLVPVVVNLLKSVPVSFNTGTPEQVCII